MRKTFTFNGKRYEVSAATADELTIKIHEKKKALESCKAQEKSITLNAWFNKYMEIYKTGVSYKTYKAYVSNYNAVIRPQIGSCAVKTIKPMDCQKVLNSMQGKSKSYNQKVYILLKDLMEKARINGYTDLKIEGLKPPNGDEGKRRQLTDDERALFLKACEKFPRGGSFLKWVYYCGLRPSEVARIEYQDIDHVRRVLKVRGTKTENAPREVPIPKQMDIKQFSGQGLIYKTSSGLPVDPSRQQAFFMSVKKEMNRMLGARTYRNKFIEWLVADDLTMYCLRHDYCTRLQEAGVPLDIASRLMGHSSVTLTAKIYQHPNAKSLNRAAYLLDRYYNKND